MMTSWDIRKAFDLVDRTLATLALGAPETLAQDMMRMDEEGEITIRSPLAVVAHGSATPAPAFRARRGITQGDVLSPLIWVAVFD